MKRKLWVTGIVAVVLPLCIAAWASRLRPAAASAAKSPAIQRSVKAAGKPRRVPVPPRFLSRRPHPGLLLGSRLAGTTPSHRTNRNTARVPGLRLARAGT